MKVDIILRMNNKHIPDLVHEYILMGWRNTDQPRKIWGETNTHEDRTSV